MVFRPDAGRRGQPALGGHHGRRRRDRRPDAGPCRTGRRRGPRPRTRSARPGERWPQAGAPDLAAPSGPADSCFATIYRAENREPSALAAWPVMLGDAALPGRPVILALHPGTRAALMTARVALPTGVRVVEPLGYRTSLALQLHAAAVITDSGGIQREAAWLGTPCLVLRSSTEWVEAVDESAGRMVVIGLDRARATRELATLAPTTTSANVARARAATVDLVPSGAARRIVEALEIRPLTPFPSGRAQIAQSVEELAGDRPVVVRHAARRGIPGDGQPECRRLGDPDCLAHGNAPARPGRSSRGAGRRLPARGWSDSPGRRRCPGARGAD